MGLYVETGGNKDKALWIMENLGGVSIIPELWLVVNADYQALVCVVDNGPFEAAAVVYDEREFVEFTQVDDFQPKNWLLVDRDILYDHLHNVQGIEEERLERYNLRRGKFAQ